MVLVLIYVSKSKTNTQYTTTMNTMNTMNNMTTNNNHLRARPSHTMDRHHNLTNNANNFINLKIGSLNCNRLSKKRRLHIQRDMIRHFREENLDIICIQESGTSDDQTINMLNMQFTTKSSIWTSKCGIVSLNKDIILHKLALPDDLNGRIILTKVTHSMEYFTPFYILNIYGPATNTHAAKHSFYTQLSQIPILSQTDIRDNMFIMGDLNYAYTKRHQMAMVADSWLEYIHSHFTDCITEPFQQPIPTCYSANGLPSTIDYIYIASNMARKISKSLVKHISRTWTDHELLSVEFQIGTTPTGKGVWRFNPVLLNNPTFCSTLKETLLTLHPSLTTYGDVQQQWDTVKKKIRTVAKRFATTHIAWRTKRLAKLHHLRNNISRDLETPPDIRTKLLQPINQEIVLLQQERVDIASLRAGQRWREKGESCAGYLKKTIAIRHKAKQIDQLVHPHSNAICTTTESKLKATQTFFQELFTSERVDSWKIRHVSSFIKPEQKLRIDHQTKLTAPISFQMLLEQTSRAPNPSSPGPDGLTYGLLHFVFQIPEYQTLITTVYNEALDKGIFPSTWHDAIICLLPKKGDLTLLQNHRPISLTNCDAKIFTRIINSRMTEAANHMINPFQTGFMRNRFIGDNGMLLKCATDIARNDPQHAQTMALLLDFMKAYDRVNGKYLKAVLTAFDVPPTLVTTIINFFFQTKLKINVNGYLTETVSQSCGIRQGDPLSPIIFNLALEPLLQMILQDQNITGMTPPDPFTQLQPPQPNHAIFKLSAYADDLLVIVRTPREYRRLISHIDTYGAASNAKLNLNKTQVLSLSGNPVDIVWESTFTRNHITEIFDRTSTTPLQYLGFPIIQSKVQSALFENNILNSLDTALQPHFKRGLSYKGKATVINSLNLSKFWHSLRHFNPSKQFFQKMISKLSAFMNDIQDTAKLRTVSWDLMTRPLAEGGLGVIDPRSQHLALQLRWAKPIMTHTWHQTALSRSSLGITIHWLKNCISFISNLSFYQQRALHNHPLDPSDKFNLNPDFHTVLPSKRHTLLSLCPSFSPLGPLLSCIDKFPDARTHVDFPLDPSTALHLPMLDILYFPSTSPEVNMTPKSLKGSIVADFFYHDSTYNRLARIEQHAPRPTLARKLHNYLMNNSIILHPFFLKLLFPSSSPITMEVSSSTVAAFHRDVLRIPSITTHSFRQEILVATPLPRPTASRITKRSWKLFWKSTMSFKTKNIWFQLLQNKSNTRVRLHRLLPDKVPSPLCPLCLPSEKQHTAEHMFVECRQVWFIWKTAIRYLLPHDHHIIRISQTSLINSLFSLRLPKSNALTGPHDMTIWFLFSSCLENIWKSYWQFSIHDAPFVPDATIAAIIRQFRNYCSQPIAGPVPGPQ